MMKGERPPRRARGGSVPPRGRQRKIVRHLTAGRWVAGDLNGVTLTAHRGKTPCKNTKSSVERPEARPSFAGLTWPFIISISRFVLAIVLYLKQRRKYKRRLFLAGRGMTAWIAGLSFLSANLGSLELNGMGGPPIRRDTGRPLVLGSAAIRPCCSSAS